MEMDEVRTYQKARWHFAQLLFGSVYGHVNVVPAPNQFILLGSCK